MITLFCNSKLLVALSNSCDALCSKKVGSVVIRCQDPEELVHEGELNSHGNHLLGLWKQLGQEDRWQLVTIST